MENPAEILDLLKKKEFDTVENLWMERMEQSPEDAAFFSGLARDLGRCGEKPRAGFLLQLLAQECRERGLWSAALQALKQAAGLAPELPGLREELRETLQACFPRRPHFDEFVARSGLLKSAPPQEAALTLERWLPFDKGQFFEIRGRGVGRVVELNTDLEKITLDLASGGGVSFRIDEAQKILTPLAADHFMVLKEIEGERLRALARDEPLRLLELFFTSAGRALSAREIREGLEDLVPAGEWTRWWARAKDESHLVASGGGRVTYQWRSSAGEAEEGIRQEFDRAPLDAMLELARRHAGRSKELDQHMAKRLISGAAGVAREKPGQALEALLLAEYALGATGETAVTAETLLASHDPADLVLAVADGSLRQRALEKARRCRADVWTATLAAVFQRSDDPSTLEVAYRELARAGPAESAGSLVDTVVAYPRRYPRQFLWVVQQAPRQGELRLRLGARTARQLVEACLQEEFRPWRQRILKLLEDPEVLDAMVEKTAAADGRALLNLLLGDCGLDGHRRELLRTRVLVRFPELGAKEDTFLVSPEALARKRAELRRLTEVDIPRNSAEIGRAAAHGDLSENHEYKSARERQLLLMSQARTIEGDLQRAREIDPREVPADRIAAGSRVLLARRGAHEPGAAPEELEVTLLGPWDSDPDHHVYSYLTPLAAELLDKRVGDTVHLQGDEKYEVKRISVWRDPG